VVSRQVSDAPAIELTVTQDEAGQRLDRILSARPPPGPSSTQASGLPLVTALAPRASTQPGVC